jgi:hypothetical protein
LEETKKKRKGQLFVGNYILSYDGIEKRQTAKEGVALMIKTLENNRRMLVCD